MKAKVMVITSLILAAALAVSSCGGKQETKTEGTRPPAPARVESVRAQAVDDYYEAVGTVRAKTTSVIASQVMGAVVRMNVREGDVVRAGQTLVEIDNRDARSQTRKAQAGVREARGALDEVDKNIRAGESAKAAAEANRNLASVTFNRYRNLLERGSVSRQEFDEVKARHEVAEAEAQRADRLLQSYQAKRRQVQAKIEQAGADVSSAEVYAGYARITAPFSGIVTARQADVGYMAAPGAPLLTLESGAGYQLEASVEESRIGSIKHKDPAVVSIEALGAQELHGTVEEIEPAADPSSRSYLVRIRLNPGELTGGRVIRSGLYGKARFLSGQRQVVTLPQQAIVRRGQLVGVYAVDEAGVAHLRLIQTGKAYGDRVEVLSGLNEGEQVVVEGAEGLADGSRVLVTRQAAQAAAEDR